MATATRKKVTAYMRLVKAKARQCRGTATAADVNKAATAYVKDAVTKGKSKTDAERSASKVKNRSCKTKVAGTRKRKTTAKRTTRR
jgi:hypothetical protein